jgi:prepilin-type N-terminal cleavage/methylation domain-containing protein
MAPKYTILKVLTRTSNKGFTLIELLVGLVITFIITGLAFDAFINSSNSFRNDQRNIDNSQNLSAILEILGNDIQQAGEQISDTNFSVVTFEPIPLTGDVQIPGAPTSPPTYHMRGSSKITVRKLLTSTLTLCADIIPTTSTNSLIVTDDSNTSANCKSGSVVKNERLLTGSTPGPLSPEIERPSTLMTARNYRCKLDDSTIDYSSYLATNNTDFCQSVKASPDLEKVRTAMSDTASGKIWTFDYVDDTAIVVDDTPTIPPTVPAIRKATSAIITIANLSTPPTTGSPAATVKFTVGTPIYLIEERTYSLDSAGNLNMQKDSGSTATLIKGIEKFNISARVYTNTTDKIIDPIDGTTTTIPASRRCDPAIPNYICSFKSSTYPTDSWKTLAGIKVDLQAKYDGTGRLRADEIDKPEHAAIKKFEYDKLSARAEFFPRNVLSK